MGVTGAGVAAGRDRVSVEVPTREVWAAVETARMVLGLRRSRPGVGALVAAGGRLRLVAEVPGASVAVPLAVCWGEGVVPVEVLRLREVVRSHERSGWTRLETLTAGVGVEVSQGDAGALLSCSGGTAEAVTVRGSAEPGGRVPSGALAELAARVTVAADGEPALPPVLGQVRVRVAGGRLSAAATDRYRLAVDALTLMPDGAASWEALVAARWFRVASERMRRIGVGPVQVGLRNGRVWLEDESGVRLSHETMTAAFPDVEGLLARTLDYAVTVDRDALVGAIDAVAPPRPGGRGPTVVPVRLAVDGDRVTVGRCTEDVDATATTVLVDAVTRPPAGYRIGLNAVFLRQALMAQPHPEIELRLPADALAAMMVCVPAGYQHLLMPVRIPD